MPLICNAILAGTCTKNPEEPVCCPHAVPHGAITDSKGGDHCSDDRTCRFCPDPVRCVNQPKKGECVCGWYQRGCTYKGGPCNQENRDVMRCPVTGPTKIKPKEPVKEPEPEPVKQPEPDPVREEPIVRGRKKDVAR